MKKRILFLFLIFFLFSGCQKKEEEIFQIEVPKTKEETIVPSYQDQNTMPISFYQLAGNHLIQISTVNGNYSQLDDIGLFQVYPSIEERVSLEKSFASSYYDEIMKYPNTKVGFSLQFTLKSGEEISYLILDPNHTMDHWEYFMAYLYDDYQNLGRSFYSHIESNEVTDSTLYTAIKLQCGAYISEVNSPITFQVFSYDSEDDFLDGHYRGDQVSTLTICINGIC